MRISVINAITWLKLDARSSHGFLASIFIVIASGVIQFILVSAGAHLYFATFFPAVFIAGLIGGTPAGAFAAFVTFPLVWWAFLPPAFEFGWLTPADYDAAKNFFVGSILLICLSDLCREITVFTASSKR